MIAVENLGIRFHGRTIFKDVTFLVNPRDRIGLTGKNGAGKTTLLKTFIGEVRPDEGEVVIPKDCKQGYLSQQMVIKDSTTLFEDALTAFDEINVLQREIDRLNNLIAVRDDYESKEYMRLIEQLSVKTERFDMLGGNSREVRAEQTLKGLGFDPDDFNRPTATFSGGWRMRLELAKILMKNPDILLLDEPTNHLDILSIQWLEDFLQNYNGAVILVSHDRAFLDAVTNRTIEISLGNIYDYNVSYSDYIVQRKERRESQLASYRNQQKKIEDTREFINRFRYKATKAVQVQSRIKQLEKMDVTEVEEEDKSAIKLKFPPAPRSGKVVFEAKGLSKSYDNKEVLHSIDMVIERGERVAFVGKNGSGKTTLTKIIMGRLDYAGEARTGINISTGYFAQNQDELMDENKTVFNTIDEAAVGEVRTKIRDILGAFLFSGEDVDKKVKVLSGGERSRLALARLLLQPYNLLVLDEPTNHLDMHSKDILKQALLAYDGTLILVSHDREFLDGLTERLYEFDNKKVKEFRGGIYDFLKKKKIDTLHELELEKEIIAKQGSVSKGKNKDEFLQRKEYDRKLRKMNDRINKIEHEIEKLESVIEEMNDQIIKKAGKEEPPDHDFYAAYEKAKHKLEDKMKIWEFLHHEYESFSNDMSG